jgi:predicted nucleotidyltransferase
MADAREALERLIAAADSGELRQLCERYGADLLVAFGSATRTGGTPRDLDIAVLFRRDAGRPALLGFLDELGQLAQTTELDLMDLGRAGPVARERALVGGHVLAELTPGTFAQEQMRAITERMDTAWLRRLSLELMAR